MLGSEKNFWLLGRPVVFLVVVSSFVLTACQPNEAELAQLRAENQALKLEIEKLRRPSGGATSAEQSGAPILDLTIDELWTQRFEDNRFRAKQRLDGKVIRLTGTVDSVDDLSVAITGHSARVGTVNVLAKLEDSYARRIHDRLANIERGREVTLQGTFQFDKMWLENATFVDRKSGKEMEPKGSEASPPPKAEEPIAAESR